MDNCLIKRYNMSMTDLIPSQVQKYFWGDNLDELSWKKHQKYITQTLLDKGDSDALKWLFDQASLTDIKNMIPKMKMSSKSKNFWQLYLS